MAEVIILTGIRHLATQQTVYAAIGALRCAMCVLKAEHYEELNADDLEDLDDIEDEAPAN